MERNNADLIALASRLASSPVRAVSPVGHEGDSCVYRVDTDAYRFALKEYARTNGDIAQRLETERHGLELLHWHGIDAIPTWIATEDNFALMTWVEGTPIKQPSAADVDNAAVFLGTLHHISHKTKEDDLSPAFEACLSGQVLVDQLEKRVAALMPFTKENPALMKFLTSTFMPAFTQRFMAAKKNYAGFATALSHSKQTLFADDFGFHNILRQSDGGLCFLDFEYFGWDDPVRLMSNFLLDPAVVLTDAMKKTFYSHALAIYGEAVAPRFVLYYPLFGMTRALIMLDIFIPERWQASGKKNGIAKRKRRW